MHKPGIDKKYCPVCGAPLEVEHIDQFGVPVGYSAACTACSKYNDIWVNGLREVQCGQWSSPDYESAYGAMTAQEKWVERSLLLLLNGHLLWERVKHKVTHMKEWLEQHKQATV